MKRIILFALVILATLGLFSASAAAEVLLTYSDDDSVLTLVDYEVYRHNNMNYLILYADFTCEGSDPRSFNRTFSFVVFQNDVECEDGYLNVPDLGDSNASKKVKNGATIRVYDVKKLNDIVSDVEIGIGPLISFSNKDSVSATFPLRRKVYQDEITGILLGASMNDVWGHLLKALDFSTYQIVQKDSLTGAIFHDAEVLGFQCDLLYFESDMLSRLGPKSGVVYLFKPDDESTADDIYSSILEKATEILGMPTDNYQSETWIQSIWDFESGVVTIINTDEIWNDLASYSPFLKFLDTSVGDVIMIQTLR